MPIEKLNVRRMLIGLLLVLVFANVYGHGGATGIVKERMDSMVSLKEAMKSLNTMINKRQDYNVDKIKEYADLIAKNSGEHMIKMFPEGSLYSPSEAKPELWDEWEVFTKMANDLEVLAKNLRDSATPSPSKATEKLFKSIRGNCSDCHDKYRE